MYFDAIFELGLLALPGGLLAALYFYVKLRRDPRSEPAPSFARYFGVAILIGIGGYIVGTAIGIYFACSSPDSGNLCGLYGALGVGPLLSGLALFLYGLSWTSQRPASTAVGASMPTTAGGHTWTAHPLVRVLAGLAGVGLALYGATALIDGQDRAAAALVIGSFGVHWGFVGRLPSWFRH